MSLFFEITANITKKDIPSNPRNSKKPKHATRGYFDFKVYLSTNKTSVVAIALINISKIVFTIVGSFFFIIVRN